MALAKVGVIGSGSVGSKLGARLLAKGFKVTYSSRDPSSDKNKQLLAQQPTAAVDTVANVVAGSDVLILATPGATSDDGIKLLAASLGPDVQGKVLLDATNPLSGYPGLEVRWAEGKSGGEVLAEALPGAFVYKAFNTIGAEHMAQPDGSAITGERLSMLFAGPEEKQAAAAEIIDAVGFAPAYAGPIRYARNLEAIAELWIHLGVPGVGSDTYWGRNFHFQVIKKKD